MGHFCSIITSLTVSPDGQYIVSTDRDHKIRVNNMPAQPMQVCILKSSYNTSNSLIKAECLCPLLLFVFANTITFLENVPQMRRKSFHHCETSLKKVTRCKGCVRAALLGCSHLWDLAL